MSLSKIPTTVRDAVNARACMRCEICGGLGTELHHRRGGSMRRYGHHISNLLRTCHADPLQATVEPNWAKARGYSLGAGDKVVGTPVLLLGQVWAWIYPDATYGVGSLAVADLGQVEHLLAAVRGQGIGPANPLAWAEPPVPAHGVVVDDLPGKELGRLVDPVRSAGVPAGTLVLGREQLRQVYAHLRQPGETLDGVADRLDVVGDDPQLARPVD